MIDNETVKNLSVLFKVPEEVIENTINKGKNLYNGISEYTGLSRDEVKRWAYGIMYSVKGKGPTI